MLALAALCALFLALSPKRMNVQTAEAGQRSNTFTVSATVAPGCLFRVANMTFPTYTSGQTTIDNGASSFEIDCTSASAGNPVPVTYTVNAPGGFNMANGANKLKYQLCFDAACLAVIPNGVGTAVLVDRQLYALPYYGQVFARQNDPTGAYKQVVNVTLNF